MIRRNTAGQTIYLPCLKLTVDGSAVTSDATLTVSKDGTESASAGTLTHSAGGVWRYTPTQGETNAAIVALILTASGADPVVLNCVTTGADTSTVAFGALMPTIALRTLNVSATGEGDAVLNTEYLFDDGFGRKAIKANVTHYQGTLQGNGDLPAKLDAIRTNTNTDIPALISSEAVKTAAILEDTGTTLPAQITAFVTKVRKFFQLSLRKDAAIATDNAAELTELNASGGSGAGGYLSTTDSQEAIRDSIAGVISSAIASAGVATTVTGIPTFLRVGDARTVANGGAIAVRLYDADDDSLLFGLGTQLFADATITFSLRRGGNDGTEGTEDAVIPCTWVASGGDGYVQIAYQGDALDDCDAMDKVKEKDCHRWGIKFQWGSDDPITPVYGTVSVLRKIVSTQ